MTDERQQVKAFILINLERTHQSMSRIEAILEPLGIPVAMVETGRRLHWTTAVVIGVPEPRLADAMLALEMRASRMSWRFMASRMLKQRSRV